MTTASDNQITLWKPVAWTDEVHVQMNKECPDVLWLRRWTLDNYADQSGIHLQPENATPAQLANLAHWLAFQDSNNGAGTLRRRFQRLDHVLYSNYSVKAIAVSQRHCSICHGGRPLEDLFPFGTYAVRITPISRQASKSEIGMFKAFQAAFAERFSGRPIDIGKTGRGCMALTFVLKHERDKRWSRDVDNMAKAVMDAFSRAVGFDDKIVHHLDVIKLIFPAAEEYMYIRIAPSALNEHGDVVASTFHQSSRFAGGRIDLANYMPEVTNKN